MNAHQISAFVKALENVFATMVQTRVEVQTPRLKSPDTPRLDVSGIIGMSGDVTGAVVLSFPVDTARRVVSLFTGSEIGPDSPDFADAVGELVNMIAGNAKADFGGLKVSISCPSVVMGESHRVLLQKDALSIEIPCNCDCGPFMLEVTIKAVAPAASQPQAAAVQA